MILILDSVVNVPRDNDETEASVTVRPQLNECLTIKIQRCLVAVVQLHDSPVAKDRARGEVGVRHSLIVVRCQRCNRSCQRRKKISEIPVRLSYSGVLKCP